jgi:SpoIID/LytB domain protein
LPAGAYEFSTTTDDGIRLWIDGKLLIDKWKDQGPTIYTAKTTLPGSGKHTIKMEYYERGGGAVAKLSWRNLFIGEYFNNAYLSGTPNLTRTDEKINFNWGSGSPASGIASDNFSVRWSSNKWFNEGAYRFTVKTDDGVRLWVDGKLLIDKWRDQGSTTYTADRIFSTGFHSIKMEYYEKGGGAVAKLSWSDIFKGEYFNNTSLSGSPALVRADDNINFDWGTGSPGSVVNNDNFSARWTSNKWFKAGAYKFSVTADDGIRLWVDGKLLIDQWKDQGPTAYTAKLVFSNDGKHSIKMEYYERGGGAVAKLSWSNIFKGEYFNNASLSGSPALVRADDNINFDWGTGSPGTNSDYFSVRWTGPIELPAGTYEFTVTADDGVRLWVDGNLLINQWKDQAPTSYKATTTFLVSGKHNIKMEYYEKGGGAVAKLSWKISPTVIIEGRGYGHGVGMSMTGVYFLAKDENWSYRDILTYYFSNTAWGSMDDNANIVAECTDGVKRTFKMKEYLYRLAEEPDSWPTEGLRAHTVAARSYAGEKMQSMGYVPKWGQNFLEYLDPNTRPNIVKAVNDTAGQILTYDGKPIVAAYSSSAGGYTAGLEDVWGGSPSPYLKQKPSSWDKNGNNYYWKVTVDKSTIESSYPQIGQFQDLKATSRSGYGDWGGRVIYMRLYGSKGTLNVKGYDFANKLGLKSNYFNFTY